MHALAKIYLQYGDFILGDQRQIRGYSTCKNGERAGRTDQETRTHCATTDLPILEFASKGISQLVRKRGGKSSDIDAFVFSCESFDGISEGSYQSFPGLCMWPRELATWLCASGLSSAFPYGNWLSGAGNAVASIAIAKALVASGMHDRVLVCMVDSSRLMTDQSGEARADRWSDAVACCLVSSLLESASAYSIDTLGVSVSRETKATDGKPGGEACGRTQVARIVNLVSAGGIENLSIFDKIAVSGVSQDDLLILSSCLNVNLERLVIIDSVLGLTSSWGLDPFRYLFDELFHLSDLGPMKILVVNLSGDFPNFMALTSCAA